jgi:DNA-binding response OmpR family regulator
MNPAGRILIIDDEPLFTQTYKSILAREGYEVDAASTAAEARAKLNSSTWDVVLLDRKLQGSQGPDLGLDLLAEIRTNSPWTRTIVVTAFADAETILRAFSDGAYDYLEKRETLETLLRVKVRNAIEAIRERKIAALANGKREAAIRETWQAVLQESDKHRKGALLEYLLAIIFKSIDGFEQTTTNRHSVDEEIDIVVRNESSDAFWLKQGTYLLAECKNWSTSVGRIEFDAFRGKLQRRSGQSHFGFFISINGFTSGFVTARDAGRESGYTVVMIDKTGLKGLVEAPDRNLLLKELCDRSIFEGVP